MSFCIKIKSSKYDTGLMANAFNQLFARGYVFGNQDRIRDYSKLCKVFDEQLGWNHDYILIGYDCECKMVLVIGKGDWSKMADFKMVTIEEYLKLIDSTEGTPCPAP